MPIRSGALFLWGAGEWWWAWRSVFQRSKKPKELWGLRSKDRSLRQLLQGVFVGDLVVIGVKKRVIFR
ncbi:hypothetical protein UB23_02805 [Pseudomonas sp. ES3-33]|nr:hypothetical protein UB23_02805 [Pseudomonas sp. ES3-33]